MIESKSPFDMNCSLELPFISQASKFCREQLSSKHTRNTHTENKNTGEMEAKPAGEVRGLIDGLVMVVGVPAP